MKRKFHNITSALALTIFVFTGFAPADEGDLNFDGVFEAALDLPRIYFLLKREPNGQPLEYEGNFELNWAFLDTGASGILLSKETTDYLEIDIHPEAQYFDVGVGGIEAFDVSEPLYIGTDTFDDPDPYNPDNYLLSGPWRFQVKTYYAGPWPDEPLDVLGIPVMAGKTVVFYPSRTNVLDYFVAEIKEPNDTAIPAADFNVPLRFEKYISPNDPIHTPPLPVLAYNPVIDNVTVEYNSQSSTGTFVFDTGATVSLMSSQHAAALGLTDLDGNPIVTPDFEIPIGGIGGDVNMPGYQIDNLIIPTLNGYNLIYNNARICVHDIGIIDEDTGEFLIIDGIFGSNLLCASAKLLGGYPVDLAESPYTHVILDTRKGLLGFDVNDVYPLPTCGDENHPQPTGDLNADCVVNNLDYFILAQNYGRDDCNSANYYCDGADIDQNSVVNYDDAFILIGNWLQSSFDYLPNQIQQDKIELEHPWLAGDLNHDYKIDLVDIQIFAEEWLNNCDDLNWICRQADINGNDTTDFFDYAAILREQED